MSDEQLGPEARAILDAARAADEPDPARIARVRHDVSRRVGLVVGAAAATTAVKTAAAASAAAAWTKGVAIVLLVAAGAGGVIAVRARRSVPAASPVPSQPSALATPTPLPTPAASPLVAQEPSPVAVPSATPSVAPVPTPRVVPAPSAAPSAVDTLAAERAFLAEAQKALSESRYPRALDLYDRYKAEYPFGQFKLECSVGRVIALCRMGRGDARSEADKLLATNPPPALAARIHAACDADAGP
ncbi:MAG: hypothetical protein HYV09_32335 [Deltaproteobacteria bacterium]|nr:hypothetical protein [Deltaproteobacteria bacterium]